MAGKNTIGARLELKGESEYRNALKQINAVQKELRSEMKQVSQEYKDSQNSLEALTKKQEILTKQIESQTKAREQHQKQLEKAQKELEKESENYDKLEKEYEEAKKALEEMTKSESASTEEIEKQQKVVEELKGKLDNSAQTYNKIQASIEDYQTKVNTAVTEEIALDQELQKTERYMDEAQQSTDHCAKSIDEYGKETKEASEESERFGERTQAALTAIGGALAAAGITRSVREIAEALKDCIEAADQYESSVAKLSTIADSSKVSMSAMSNELLNLSTQTGQAASELAETAYNAISAGVDTANAVDAAAQASKLAVAGFTDTTSALSLLTTAMNSYHLEASEMENISDSLLVVQNKGVTTVEQLAQSMGSAIATASAFNVDLSNLEAAYIGVTKAGISTAESTTYISAMINELGKSGSKTGKILKEETGESFGQLMNDGYSLADVLNILYESVDNDSEAMMQLWGNVRAGKGASALVNQGLKEFNNNLDAIHNSAGATSEAFETMMDTSEMTSQRMENAIQNLKIAIGEELQPTIDDIKEGIGDFAEKAAEFVHEHPEIVRAIAAITAGFTALIAGIGAATAATAIWTAALNTNPIFLAITAITALTTAIAAFAAGAEDSTAEIKELSASTQELHEKIRQDAADREAQRQSMLNTISVVDELVPRIEKLNGKEKLSAEDKKNLKKAVDQLNEAMPELNLQLEEESGKLNMTNDEFERLIGNQKELMLLQAAEADLQAIANDLYEAKKKQAEIEQDIADKQTEINEKTDEYNRLIAEGADLTTIQDADVEIQLLNDDLEKLTELGAENQEVVNEQEAAYDELYDSIYKAEEETEGLAEATVEYNGKVYQTTSEVAANIEDLKTAYYEAKAAAEESLESQIGLFDELSNKSDLTVDQMAKNLESQAEVLNQYADDLAKASEYAKDDSTGNFQEILDKISEMGIDGAGYLRELVSAAEEGGDSFDQVVENFGKVQEAEDKVTDAQAELATGYHEYADQILEDGEAVRAKMEEISENMPEYGKGVPEGLADGVNDEEARQELTNAVDDMVEEVKDTITNEDGFDENSPSKVTKEYGEYLVVGLQKGIEDEEKREDLKKSMQKLCQDVIEVVKGNEFGFDINEKKKRSELFYKFGLMVDQGLADGIRAGQSMVVQAMIEMCLAAIAAAKEALGIASPSKEFMKLGDFVGEGFGIGIERSMPDISGMIQDVIPDASIADSLVGVGSAYGWQEQQAMSILADRDGAIKESLDNLTLAIANMNEAPIEVTNIFDGIPANMYSEVVKQNTLETRRTGSNPLLGD